MDAGRNGSGKKKKAGGPAGDESMFSVPNRMRVESCISPDDKVLPMEEKKPIS